jgi:hypothetical protein
MEANQIEVCATCSKSLPINGFFCGGCLTQFKCKSCSSFLEKDYAGCTNCGAPREQKVYTNNASSGQIANTFRLHETSTDRTIEATFSDTVGKGDLNKPKQEKGQLSSRSSVRIQSGSQREKIVIKQEPGRKQGKA